MQLRLPSPRAAMTLALAVVAVVPAVLPRGALAHPWSPLISALLIAMLAGLDAMTHRRTGAVSPRTSITVDLGRLGRLGRLNRRDSPARRS